MKTIFNILICLVSAISFAQETGSIAGVLTDKETGDQPLPFANVTIKGTTKGTTTDFDGLYQITNIEPGTYTVVFSFVGYETLEVPNVKVVANKETEVNTGLGASAAALDEVLIKTVARRDSQTALLLDQKDAIDIKESIGAQELAKLGVSDAATATTKISGVSSSEASGDVYVRGLGDRYLYTTLNGLTVPSDNIDKKNIDLGLFPTRIVQSVSINKNFMPENTSDQSSGSINITSTELAGTEEFSISAQTGINTNAIEQDEFKQTANRDDISFGFYSNDISTKDAITQQSWNTQSMSLPLNYKYALTAGKKIGDNFKILFTGSQSSNYEYNEGIFQQFDRNLDDVRFTDATYFTNTINTTGLLDLSYSFNKENKIKAVSLFVNKMQDQVFEAGRNREGFVFEEVNNPDDFSQFVRDQNTKQTKLWVNQLLGDHQFGENHHVTWGFGYNQLDADEPNRMRNEVNIENATDTTPESIQLANQGGTQQRKQYQEIDDAEYTARLKDEFKVFENDTISSLKLSFGGNFRNKTRDFESDRIGVDEVGAPGQVVPPSIDDLGAVFTQGNFDNGTLRYVEQLPDTYTGELNSTSGFLSVNYSINKFNFNVGARYQNDEINVDYNVGNARGGREGSTSKNYDNIYPAINIKYALNEKNNLRLAASKTITLPEFKEIAPFGYVSPTNQVIVGNTDIEASNVYNLDLKWEFFPSSGELISATGFFKQINDPINRTLDRGSSGYFTFFNTSEKAEVYGLELEANVGLISSEEENGVNLDLGFNFTRMWHTQDLKTNYNEEGNIASTFRYNGKSEIGLEGASDYIVNTSFNFSTNWEKEFNANISGNYSSDKIYAIGSAPDSQTIESNLYNNEIIEKGFVTLNATLNQEITKNFSVNFKALNLLDPEIERTQDVLDIPTGQENTETIRSYKKGMTLSLGFNYKF
ncbi:TonB-dependent receptor [Mesonia sp.]|uniref:TonB-dependent receptor n=1 Tax=Mesonia sp. TaxID=1960830 RepID=UPI001778201D|nr:TonB-dependent receptor [Mesonia sp.]HIB36552.1 TonB-dependent receptor [Mesonia sp.]HIO27254.1 TonB-dependent receptor [Flavobacteriaceae bacterium]